MFVLLFPDAVTRAFANESPAFEPSFFESVPRMFILGLDAKCRLNNICVVVLFDQYVSIQAMFSSPYLSA